MKIGWMENRMVSLDGCDSFAMGSHGSPRANLIDKDMLQLSALLQHQYEERGVAAGWMNGIR